MTDYYIVSAEATHPEMTLSTRCGDTHSSLSSIRMGGGTRN